MRLKSVQIMEHFSYITKSNQIISPLENFQSAASVFQTMHNLAIFTEALKATFRRSCEFLRECSLRAVGAKYKIPNKFCVCPCQANGTAAEVKAFGHFLRRTSWKLLTCLCY
jgi:hypothetical protein